MHCPLTKRGDGVLVLRLQKNNADRSKLHDLQHRAREVGTAVVFIRLR